MEIGRSFIGRGEKKSGAERRKTFLPDGSVFIKNSTTEVLNTTADTHRSLERISVYKKNNLFQAEMTTMKVFFYSSFRHASLFATTTADTFVCSAVLSSVSKSVKLGMLAVVNIFAPSLKHARALLRSWCS